MHLRFQLLPAAVFAVVILCWLIFAPAFLFRKRPPRAPERKRDRTAFLEIFFEALGYALVWSVRRPMFTPLVSTNLAIEVVVAAMITFWFRTNLRIQVEEGLLRDEFGEEFDMCVKEVPALLPKFRR